MIIIKDKKGACTLDHEFYYTSLANQIKGISPWVNLLLLIVESTDVDIVSHALEVFADTLHQL